MTLRLLSISGSSVTGETVSTAATATVQGTPTTAGAPPALAITTATVPAGTVGQSYSQTIATNNVGTAPYTFSVTSGSLPDGLTLSSAGVLSGTPTTAGAYTFTVTVKDSVGNTATRIFTQTVNGAAVTPKPPVPPTVTLTDIAGNWAQANIEKLVSLGAITGYPDGTSPTTTSPGPSSLLCW